MAALPVIGAVVGVAGTVSQISNSNAQAEAQQNQIQAQEQSLQIQGASQQANLNLQLNQLARQQTYAASQAQITNLQQVMTAQQDQQNIALQSLQVQNQQAASIFGAQAGQAQAGIAATQQQEQAAGQLYASNSSANAQEAQQLQAGTQQLTQLGNEGYKLNKQLTSDESMQGQVGLAMAAKQEGATQLQDTGATNPFTDVTGRNVIASRQQQMLGALQNYQQKFGNVSGDVLHQLAYSQDFTNLLKQYGMQNFQDTLGNIATGLNFSTEQGNAAITAANSQANLAQSSLAQASQQRTETFDIQQAQSNLNTDFYDVSLGAQGSAIQAQTAGQLAAERAQTIGLDAQASAPSANPMGVLGYASAGLGLYNASAGLFNQPSSASSVTNFSLINGDGTGGGVFGYPSQYGTDAGDYGFISGGLT